MDESLKRNLVITVTVLCVGVCGYYVWSTFGQDKVADSVNTIVLKCAESGEEFEVRLTADFPPYPHENPKTHAQTLYPAEVCYWGEECRKRGGTRVILNSLLGKEEPTYCPVCGHIVRPRNPRPPDLER